ncbi:MAG: hypothetical protein ACREFY_00330, partial [Acetobacteraceae bacterium]
MQQAPSLALPGAQRARMPGRLRFLLDRTEVLGPILLTPATLYILLLVAVPFLLAVYYSLSAYTIYHPSYRFVGLRNFIQIAQDSVFQQTLANTFIFTFGS